MVVHFFNSLSALNYLLAARLSAVRGVGAMTSSVMAALYGVMFCHSFLIHMTFLINLSIAMIQ